MVQIMNTLPVGPSTSAAGHHDGDELEQPVISTISRGSFRQLGVAIWLADQCAALGLQCPTPVQAAAIPPALAGRDVIGCARTGTGKTLAFALPILQRLAADPFGIHSLILTPTRELAFQIADQLKALGKPIGIKVVVIVGGREMLAQSADIARRPHVMIATPGRLADHIQSGSRLPLENLECLVLDEADRLLDGQYENQLTPIFEALPTNRQSLLFSATITDALSRLKDIAVKKPFFWEDKSDVDVITVAGLEQRYVLCPVDVKDAYVVHVVTRYHDRNPDASIIIFAQTCRECQALWMMFRDLGFKKVYPLHSMITQRERLTSLAKFRAGIAKILLCTDVAARGLDIPHVSLIVNHNVPAVPKNYVHRVGRAARAGRSGQAITFVTQYDVQLLQAIEALIGTQIKELKVAVAKVAKNVTEVLVAKREAEVKLDQQNFGEKREINRKKQMILEGMDPDEADKAMEKMKEDRKYHSKKRIKRLKTVAADRKLQNPVL